MAYISGGEGSTLMLVADGGIVRCQQAPRTLPDNAGLLDLNPEFSREPFVHTGDGR